MIARPNRIHRNSASPFHSFRLHRKRLSAWARSWAFGMLLVWSAYSLHPPRHVYVHGPRPGPKRRRPVQFSRAVRPAPIYSRAHGTKQKKARIMPETARGHQALARPRLAASQTHTLWHLASRKLCGQDALNPMASSPRHTHALSTIHSNESDDVHAKRQLADH